ncbi:DUF3019 domain-containing protein [Arsukibacterium sp.]|uniref:DUF3019 domain-containing protein n=1 Tax=Arsukibacterium sp. TaxID=1977258 RepID=UPI002FD9E869
MQLLSLIGMIMALSGNGNLAERCQESLCWQVSPTVCVTEQQQASCRAELTLRWHSQQPQSLCFYLAEQSMQCWHQATAGEFKQMLDWHYGWVSLRANSDLILLSTELQVLSRQPLRRRRVAGPWSLF